MRNCHVRRLTIQAPDAAAARRGAVLVEDGLRTASLPGESSRLVIVRRLDIGVIPSGANATALAQRIEHVLTELPVYAVAAAQTAAAGAAAVYFADEVEACVQLAVQGARGQNPTAWFWPRAVPGWQNGYSAADAVRCALAAAARLDSGPVAVARVVAELQAEGLLDEALAALAAEDGPALLQLCGWRSPAPDVTAPHGTAQHPGRQHRAAGMHVPHDERLAPWITRWGTGDARTLWLATVLLATEQPARASAPMLIEQGAAWVQQLSFERLIRPHVTERTVPSESRPIVPLAHLEVSRIEQQADRAMQQAADSIGRSPGRDRSARDAQPPGVQQSVPAVTQRASADELPQLLPNVPSAEASPAMSKPAPEPVTWWRGLPLRFTEAAGLWLLLSVLRQLGITSWLQENPNLVQTDVARRVLAELARRLEVSFLDPVWSELEQRTAGAADLDDLDMAVAWWCGRVEAWCAELPGLSLPAIVCRPGWLYTTRTHVDVFFDLEQADVRNRRLGLDLDPGWVPWLGRVVTFYFETGLAAARGGE